MNKTSLSLMIAAALIGSPLLPTQALAAVQQHNVNTLKTESVTTSLSFSQVDAWYSKASITLRNVSGQPLDLDSAKIWVTSNKEVGVNNVWGADGFSVNSHDANTFVFTHDTTSAVLENGQSITLTFGLNAMHGDSVDKNDVSITKVVIKNDPALQGKIILQATEAPHPSLAAAPVLIEGENYRESVFVPWGTQLSVDHLEEGEYHITTLDVSSEMGIAHGSSTASIVDVDNSAEQARVSLNYAPFVYYASLTLNMPALTGVSGKLSTNLNVRESDSNDIVRNLEVPFASQVAIEKLFNEHKYSLEFSPLTVNNVRYQPENSGDILLDRESENKITPDVSQTTIDSDNFRIVKANIIDLPSEALPIELSLISKDGDNQYHYQISDSSFTLPDKVQPDEYHIQIGAVFADGARYAYQGDEQLIVTTSTEPLVISLPFRKAMSLAVKGFPDYVANGTVTNDGVQATTEIGTTKVNAIFKYAGFSGSGDPGQILDKDTLPLHKTYKNANTASQQSGHHILPVMVVYTANASGGASWSDLIEQETLYKHYATFITQAIAAQEYALGDGSSPMSFVLNPDFLGELQKNPDDVTRLNQEGAVDVNAQLQKAIDYMKEKYNYLPPSSIPNFDNSLKGYIASINFIMNEFAKDVTYGWQINLWAVGSANWIHQTDDQSSEKGSDVASFVNSLDVYTGTYRPDYIVFDKYERDGFGPEAIANYAYNATSWTRYLSYVKTISDGVKSPAMIWQIPGGHMPTQEQGNSFISADHEASGGSYFMGDASIATDTSKIRAGLLDKPLSASIYNGASNVGQLLEKDQGYDWSKVAMHDLPKNNVFAVLWGGGSTTAVVSIGSNGTDHGWLSSKVDAYTQNPACLAGSDCDGSIWGGDDTPPVDNLPPSVSLAPNYQVNSGEQMSIKADASDPDGDSISYHWSVPAELTVIGDTNSDTLVVTAPTTATNLTFSIDLLVSDGELNASDATRLNVIGSNNDDGVCADIPQFEQKQYKPGVQVNYGNDLYQSERWTDGGKTPDEPYSGWEKIGSCS